MIRSFLDHDTFRYYLNPEGPALGSFWMNSDVVFNKIKLTNNPLDQQGHVSVFFK